MTNASETSMTGALWSSIAAALRDEIATGLRPPGQRLPTEAALSARFGVNRHTVRRALAQLADEGLVRSRRGAGVFVTAQPTDYPLGRRVSYTRNLEAAGRLPSRRYTAIEARGATEHEAQALDLPPGARVVAAEGVSSGDGHPLAHFASTYPADRLPGIAEALRRTLTVTAALRACGVADYVRHSTRITAIVADPVQAVLLDASPGAPLVRVESVNVDPQGRPIQWGVTCFLSERVTLTLDHS